MSQIAGSGSGRDRFGEGRLVAEVDEDEPLGSSKASKDRLEDVLVISVEENEGVVGIV